MSLAVSSGGLGAGGAGGGMAVAMAHQPNAVTQHVQAPQGANNARGTTSAPRTASGLAADVVDKKITAKQIRNSKHMPIVCMDLYGDGEVAYVAAEGMSEDKSRNFVALGTIGSNKSNLVVKRNDEASYRALRKLLSKGEKGEGYYNRALSSSLMVDADDSNDAEKTVNILSPHLLLGARRVSQLHPNTLAKYPHSSEDLKPIDKNSSIMSSAIQQFDQTSSKTGVSIRNQSLDGSAPEGVDFDRVALQLDLLPNKKKPLTILPDEAVSILLAKARSMVESDTKIRFPDFVEKQNAENNTSGDDDEENLENYLDYPMAVAVPGWHTLDASVESHLEAMLGTGSEGMVYHRCIAALTGALLPRGDKKKEANKLVVSIHQKAQAIMKSLEKKKKKGSKERVSVEGNQPLVLAIGVTEQGIEAAACIVSKYQNSPYAYVGNIKTLTEVALRHDDPLSQTQHVLEQIMEESIHKILPEENHVPCAIMTFGNSTLQEQLKTAVRKVLKIKEKEWGMLNGGPQNNENVPILSSREEAVAMGACALAAGSHGRIVSEDGQKVTTTVNNVSSCALGVKLMYFKDEDIANTDVKVIFDFDRRLPATPYTFEFSAAECAAMRARGKGNPIPLGEHLDVDEINKFTGGKNISVREEAAIAFKIQIVQRCERNGAWIDVGDPLKPLHIKKDEDDEKAIAIESSILELSIGPAGLIMTQAMSDQKTVVEATKSARNSKILYYLGLLFAILFVGGFLVKSYVDEKILDRDTAKLLAYYKAVVPNSIRDGDEHHARYMVYKYRNKKAKLWKTLEKKYGIPLSDDYSFLDEDEEEVVELDDEESKEKEQPDL